MFAKWCLHYFLASVYFKQERKAHHRARDVTMHSMVFIRVFSEGR